ncbi:zinc ribbon domain-containing protein [Bremerella cremea]|uniref:FmdB family transcriptional regulator n=1 Tax=Blastopirellula marina TaxID=124 RepID=A0A2S8FBQ4_9BACT|nr:MULTISPECIES: zinc ribbon domain-containing protein [Pirellulaceae]PQO29591.1 FmdB family transcriptional regulator [Blastopirellula marina]RCS42894.1 zinc ribbon domain-containing protein [Bremerella cremea]
MPTYEYQCDACNHKFEEFQSISADPLTKCPECKKKKLRRLFSTGGGLLFKGSGFYITDYRSDSYKKSAEKGSKSSESSKPAKKSDSKGSSSSNSSSS